MNYIYWITMARRYLDNSAVLSCQQTKDVRRGRSGLRGSLTYCRSESAWMTDPHFTVHYPIFGHVVKCTTHLVGLEGIPVPTYIHKRAED